MYKPVGGGVVGAATVSTLAVTGFSSFVYVAVAVGAVVAGILLYRTARLRDVRH
ncbi:hypothetical protein [Cellulosimicrobium cellulans]|uniref:hypothetical protein n=1 Tax=Cellulosimicrobium cellulans TaxID=1710 RepID=UPI0024072148|nr:hypothetical protein [Cellulosimicrobium cellulans]MDF9875484.1 ABC-type anion transport system duplicated permease subunit [Cellulosimicrobium cellulans]